MKKKKSNLVRHLWLLILGITITFQANAQDALNLRGNVSDKSGEPLIGATVAVIGTTNGSITHVDGSYTLSNVPANATIRVSFMGYKVLMMQEL